MAFYVSGANKPTAGGFGTNRYYVQGNGNVTTTAGFAIAETGTEITVESLPYLGYLWSGWYQGDNQITDQKLHKLTGTDSALTLKATCTVDPKMQDFNFVSTLSTCIIKGKKNPTASYLVIPDYVTSIAQNAFKDDVLLTGVTLGKGISTIGNDAFANCHSLIEVKNLSSLNIVANSSGYGYIAAYAKHVYNDGESYLHSTDEGFIFYEEGTDCFLIKYNGSNRNLTLPKYDGNKEYAIYDYSFNGCTGLTSVTIGNSVTSIGQSAFYGCSGLVSITIPFVGATKDGSSNAHLGYIFGASSYSDHSSYVPSSLKTVTPPS